MLVVSHLSFSPNHAVLLYRVNLHSYDTMGIRSLVSLGFFLLPVAVTLGVLLSLQAHRQSQGMPPPFVSNKVDTKTYCQRAFGISPATHGQQYTREFSPFCHDGIPILLLTSSVPRAIFPKPTTTAPSTSVELIEFPHVPELSLVGTGWDPLQGIPASLPPPYPTLAILADHLRCVDTRPIIQGLR